jgi:hypothetical protein
MQLHVLQASDPSAPFLELTVAYWIDVPSAFRTLLANPQATSQVPWVQAADVAALRSGAMLEVVETLRWADPPAIDEALAQLKLRVRALLADALTRKGAQVTRPAFWQRGLRYDATTDAWTVMA